MASFDLDDDEPPEDVDERLAWRLVRAANRDRTERSTLWQDGDVTDGELQQAAELLGQPVQRRPR